jgi:ribonuclease R
MERNAVDAERASDDIKICEYMADKIGEHYDGVISSIIDAGCFVRLENTIEGFVPFRSLRDHYFFDDRSYRAIGAHGGKILSIGMPVTVIVEKVDTEENKIDFSFEYGFEEERDPREQRMSKGMKKEPHRAKKGGRNVRPASSKGRGAGRSAGAAGRPGGSKGFVGKPRKGGSGKGKRR